jgi:hypothetical protein
VDVFRVLSFRRNPTVRSVGTAKYGELGEVVGNGAGPGDVEGMRKNSGRKYCPEKLQGNLCCGISDSSYLSVIVNSILSLCNNIH